MSHRSLARMVVALAALAALAGTSVGGAGDTAPGSLGELRSAPLLGGYRLLQPLGIRTDVPRAQIVPLLVRRLHAAPEGSPKDVESGRAAFLESLAALERLERAFSSPDGIALADVRDRETRQAVGQALDALGLELVEQRDTLLTRTDSSRDAESRRRALARAGIDGLDALNRLNAGERVRVAVPALAVPLPLDTQSWARLTGRRELSAAEWLGAILQDRRASLVAYGLLGMDAESRGWLASTPDALRAAWDNPGGFAIAARNARLRAGELQLPGGADAIPAWERLAGARASAPSRFLRQVFERDSGRLAYFFDAIAQLDPRHLRFVLAGSRRTPEPLRELYSIVTAGNREWNASRTPFLVPRLDTPLVLRSLLVRGEGTLAGPAWRALWRAVESRDPPSARTATAAWLERDGTIDAAWIARYVAGAPLAVRQRRLNAVLFAQRAFMDAAASDAPDIAFVLVHHETYPMLPMAIERLGIRTPGVYAGGIRAAIAIGGLDRDRRPVALSQFQGALALLDRLHAHGGMTGAETEAAATELIRLRLHESRLYEGRVAEWLATHVAPAWLRVAGLEQLAGGHRFAAVLAGYHSSEPPVPFEWEGQRYVARPSDFERIRLQKGLDSARGASVDRVLAVWSAVSDIRSARTLEELEVAVGAGASIIESAALVELGLTPGERNDAAEQVRRALDRLRSENNLRDVEDHLRPLLALVDRLTADALRTVAYLVSVPAEDLANTPDLAARHDFGLVTVPSSDERERTAPWLEADTASDPSGSRLRGSLLGLGAAQPLAALRRLTSTRLPGPPSVAVAARSVLAHTVVLSTRLPPDDEGRDAIAEAIRRGWERIARWAAGDGTLDGLAGHSEWRAAALEWVRREAADEVAAQFTLYEALRLGMPGPLDRLQAYGVSQHAVSGCACLRIPPAVAWETLAGRPASPEPAAHFVDVPLRVATALSDLEVPASLFPLVLAMATHDVIETASGVEDDDMMALTRAARALTRERIADYVAAVVGRGAAAFVEERQ